MKLEAGKSYKAINGSKVVMLGRVPTPTLHFPWSGYSEHGPSYWADSGRFTTHPHHLDLVAEWEDPKPKWLAYQDGNANLIFRESDTAAPGHWIRMPWLDEPGAID